MGEQHFFLGKGGVGKTTIATIASFRCSQNKESLIISMDPAHNLNDFTIQELTDKPTKILPNLYALEVNLETARSNYLNGIKKALQQNYNYQKSYFPEDYFTILQDSPQTDELAMLLIYKNIVKTYSSRFELFFDMPPTALCSRFFSLPSLSIKWLNHLSSLRSKIKAKKDLISEIQLGKYNLEQDNIMLKLNELHTDYNWLIEQFASPDTNIWLVCNTDKFSINETLRLQKFLKTLNITPNNLVVNKVTQDYKIPDFLQAVQHQYSLPAVKLQISEIEDLVKLSKHLKEHSV